MLFMDTQIIITAFEAIIQHPQIAILVIKFTLKLAHIISIYKNRNLSHHTKLVIITNVIITLIVDIIKQIQ